jgi:hypothetical protein
MIDIRLPETGFAYARQRSVLHLFQLFDHVRELAVNLRQGCNWCRVSPGQQRCGPLRCWRRQPQRSRLDNGTIGAKPSSTRRMKGREEEYER